MRGGNLEFNDDSFLIPLSQVKSVVQSHSVLNRPGGRRLLTETEARNTFSEWIGDNRDTSAFDLFLSYRWGPSDSVFVQCLYDRFSLYTLGSDNREVHVFLDKECLQEGRMFQNQFASCLRSAHVAVPIVSSDALIRFCTGDGSVEDNVMVEVCVLHYLEICTGQLKLLS